MSKKRADGRTAAGQFAKGRSGNPSGIRKATAQVRADEWQNFFNGIGTFSRDKRIGTHFHLNPLSFDQLKDLWLGDDLAARAVETIPKEAMRQGYDVVVHSSDDTLGSSIGEDPQQLASEVQDKLDLLGADEYLEVAGNYERGYGGGAILIGANDGQADLTKPLDLRRVRSLDWLTPLEARELLPMYAYADPRAPKYGMPEIYQLQSRTVLPAYSGNYAATTMLVHESRLLIFPGIRVSRYQTTTARGGWGESVLSRVHRVLRDFNQAWSSAGVLVTDFAQSVIKIAGLWEALATDGDKAFQQRLQVMEFGRNVTNAVTIDAGDSYERQQTPMTGLPDLLDKFAVRLAAACDMPLTLLFGTSPAGLNATGESDVRFFYDRVAAYQRRRIEPHLRRLCQIIFRTMGAKREPDKWHVKFRPLWQDSTKDRAAAMFQTAQADNLWVTMGALSAEEVSASHWGKGEFDPNITVDFEAREAQEQAAASPVTPEDEAAMQPDDYVPPPAQGSAPDGPAAVPAPGKPAAADPNTRPVSTVKSEDSADLQRERPAPGGQLAPGYVAPTDVHLLADGEGPDVAAAVREQLEGDYDEGALEWIDGMRWEGPQTVPLDDIDYAGRESWRAASEPDKVHRFEKRIRGGWVKPIILIRRPGEKKLMVADGHHRATAYWNLGRAPVAYIGDAPTPTGPWDEFHSQQHEKRHDEPGGIRQTEIGHADAWSDEARQAAIEARQKNLKKLAEGKDAHIHVTHGVKDPKGREVGGHAVITHDPKRGYGVKVVPTRNGEMHGARGSGRVGGVYTEWHATAGEAHASAEAKLQKQGASYRVKFGPEAKSGPFETRVTGTHEKSHEAAPAAKAEGPAHANSAVGRAAKQASGKAHTLSNNAQLMKEPEHQARAASLHQKAAEAQTAAGNHEKAAAHLAKAAEHAKNAGGTHGGEHKPGKGEGHGKGEHEPHGEKHKEGKEFGKGLKEGLKEIGETVAGEKASKVAGQLSGGVAGGGEGEGGEE